MLETSCKSTENKYTVLKVRKITLKWQEAIVQILQKLVHTIETVKAGQT